MFKTNKFISIKNRMNVEVGGVLKYRTKCFGCELIKKRFPI